MTKRINRISPISYENGYEDGYEKGVKETKEQLSELIVGLPPADLFTLRAIINGKLGKRTITKEQQVIMQMARKKNS